MVCQNKNASHTVFAINNLNDSVSVVYYHRCLIIAIAIKCSVESNKLAFICETLVLTAYWVLYILIYWYINNAYQCSIYFSIVLTYTGIVEDLTQTNIQWLKLYNSWMKYYFFVEGLKLKWKYHSTPIWSKNQKKLSKL